MHCTPGNSQLGCIFPTATTRQAICLVTEERKMPDRQQVFSVIADAIGQHFLISPEMITEETTASCVDGWDSLSHVTLIIEIERRLNVRLPVRETTEASNVGQLVQIALEAGASK